MQLSKRRMRTLMHARSKSAEEVGSQFGNKEHSVFLHLVLAIENTGFELAPKISTSESQDSF
jgi:chromosomal replication initiation ATPase DnaA